MNGDKDNEDKTAALIGAIVAIALIGAILWAF